MSRGEDPVSITAPTPRPIWAYGARELAELIASGKLSARDVVQTHLDRIAEVWETRLDRGWNRASFTAANFWDVRMLNRSFSEIAAINWSSANLTGLDQPEHVSRGEVTAGFSEHLESRQWSPATLRTQRIAPARTTR